MAPTLFSIMLSAIVTDDFQDCDAGFLISYRFDGKLFNLRRLQAKSKVQTDVLDKLRYTDDMAENANTEIKCKGLWIEFHLKSRTTSQSSVRMDKDCTLLINQHIWEAFS